MKILIIFNREPYDNTDVTWNGLRLAGKLQEAGKEVRIFLMNDSVDMARDVCKPPESYDQDLSRMLKELIAKDVPVKVCGTCMPAVESTRIIHISRAQRNPPCRSDPMGY